MLMSRCSRLLTAAVLALLIAGCGFQLRGTASLPFETLYIPGAAGGGVPLDLKRNVQAGTNTRVLDEAKDAQAQINFTEIGYQRNILSLSVTGRIRELQLVYKVGFRLHDGKGGEYLPVTLVQATRDLTYSDTDVLAKEAEEANIFREMQSDVVQQVLRRMSGATRPKPVVQ